jgi:cullin 1
LACGKFKVLRKQPEGRSVSTSDSFAYNAAYTDKGRRVRIPLPTIDEKKKVVEDVDKDRRYAVDAAIVRVMKSRKVVAHNTLVTDVTQQLSNMFKADVKLIKKRIEELISRDYIKRDETQANTYHYVA